MQMILTTVTDEVFNDDLKKSVEIATQEGITHFEIRRIEGRRFPLIEEDDLKKLKIFKDEYALTYTAVSPGTFKVPLRSKEFNYHRGELMDKTMAMAEELDVNKIIIFSVKRDPSDQAGDLQQVIEELGNVARRAEKNGFTVMIENEPGFWADTSENCLKILKAINMKKLRLNWDPGNLFKTGEHDYKPGYERLKSFIANVHLKDAKLVEGENLYVPLGEGEINYQQQIADLRADGYKGCLTVETHCHPLPDTFIQSVAYLKKLLG
jgi:sugar phosphate isomerase/epimerase